MYLELSRERELEIRKAQLPEISCREIILGNTMSMSVLEYLDSRVGCKMFWMNELTARVERTHW